MKTFSILITAASLAMGAGAAAAPSPKEAAQPAVSISEIAPGRFELIYSGTNFSSRDGPERTLLLSSARLALAHGQDWFVLLAMPGERTDMHPARPNPAFGAKYGHWQPHWNYYVPQTGWQWWHPEWGADFWTKDVDPKAVERFEVHAMIDLGPSASSLDQGLQFKAPEIVGDLGRPSSVPKAHDAH